MTTLAAPPASKPTKPPPRVSPLAIAIAISVLLHLGLLAIRVVEPEGFNRIVEDTPLEVILVNARSDDVPDQPQAIAQHNLSGGGNLEEQGIRATSPLPPSPFDSFGTELGPTPHSGGADDAQDDADHDGAPTHQQIDAMQREQMELLAQVKGQIASLPVANPDEPASSPQRQAQAKKRQLLLSIVGEIERRIQAENSRPRRRYIGPSTVKGVQALYYDTLKQKIEDKGTTNFPEHNGQKLYGELIVRMVVNHDGNVLETQIMQTSGNRMLDRRAEAIAVSAGPFDAFDTELRKFTDQLVVVSRFKFARNNTLETQQSSYQDVLRDPTSVAKP